MAILVSTRREAARLVDALELPLAAKGFQGRAFAARTTGVMRVGDAVLVRAVSIGEARRKQTAAGGWADSMASLLGREDTVTEVHGDAVKVLETWWNPTLLGRKHQQSQPLGIV